MAFPERSCSTKSRDLGTAECVLIFPRKFNILITVVSSRVFGSMCQFDGSLIAAIAAIGNGAALWRDDTS